MTSRRTLILLTLAAVAIFAAASWWRSGHDAPLAALPTPSESTTTDIPAPAPQTNPSSLNQEAPGSPSSVPVSQDTAGPEVEDQPQVSPTPGTTPSAQTGQAREQWRPVVIGFARAYVAHRNNSAAWRGGLNRYSSPAVRQILANSDPAQAATRSAYDAYEVLEYHNEEVVAQVTYADGTALVLYIAQDDSRSWNVRAFDRLAE